MESTHFNKTTAKVVAIVIVFIAACVCVWLCVQAHSESNQTKEEEQMQGTLQIEQQASQTNEELQAIYDIEGWEEFDDGMASMCPAMEVPTDWVFEQCKYTQTGSVWIYETSNDVDSAAMQALNALQSANTTLVESYYLDLSQTAWGCVAKLPDELGSAVVTLIPVHVYEDDESFTDVLSARIVVYNAAKVPSEVAQNG